MGTASHSIILKVQEVYYSNDKIHLVSNSLKGTHVCLAELSNTLDESQITVILEKLLQMCVKLHSDGITVCNLHPNNIFIDEDYPEDVLVTDVGFAYIPEMLPETQLQTLFQAPEIRGKTGIGLEKVVREARGNADLYSICKIAEFLLCGHLDYSA